MENDTVYSFFEKARTDNLVFNNYKATVFKLPDEFVPISLRPLAVKYGVKTLPQGVYIDGTFSSFMEMCRANTSLTPVVNCLPRMMGQTLFSSDAEIEIKHFIEGKSLEDILNKKHEEFEKNLLPIKTNEDPFDRARKLAKRFIAKMLADLPEDHYISMMQDVKDLNDRGYSIDPHFGNILLTEKGLRLIDYVEFEDRQYNCAKEIKDVFFDCLSHNSSKMGDNQKHGADKEFLGWKKTIAEKLHSAAKKCGVGINTPKRPNKEMLAMMEGSAAHEGVRISIKDAPHVLQHALEEMARNHPFSNTSRA